MVSGDKSSKCMGEVGWVIRSLSSRLEDRDWAEGFLRSSRYMKMPFTKNKATKKRKTKHFQ